ncbi:hypothetical protein AZI86_03415 [Bdellovibrio bacteriovorus]|uniref:Uncharacterized protein n=1 Tax=Bdellovibrio bacteriovorus TaxID=959 RepID=A0A150WPK5_BDEBC|nr:hypothetical protein [Bdellovibrio bacteriovorus]KYG66125.1 hypothetical protein AZI86_03415 [Bdellovibrio bacteriovorus]
MKLWMRIVVPFTIVMSIAVGAQAQMWGAGVYGGMQACPYDYGAAQGATSDLDAVREAQQAIEETKRELNKKKSELKRVETKVKRSRSEIERAVDGQYTDALFNHMDNAFSCHEYADYIPNRRPNDAPTPVDEEDGVVASGSQGGQRIDSNAGKQTHDGIDADTWGRVCRDRGDLNKEFVCSSLRGDGGRGVRVGRGTPVNCTKAITEYRRNNYIAQKLQTEIENLEANIDEYKEDKRMALQEARDEAAERRREQLEGGVCLDCLVQGNSYQYQRPQTDWASVVGNVGLGLVSMYAGYKTNKMVANANANIGWPTDPWAAQGYGYGLGAIATGMGQVVGGGSGIYGAMGGGIGQGGFGCAGNNGGPYGMMGPYGGMNGAGMWGNPYGMAGLGFPGMGGGMYNPGMGPWGMAGPFGGMGGGMGMGFPGMGGGMGYPGMGAFGGLGMAGMGYPGMGMAGGMGYPGMGMAGMGYPGMGAFGGLGMAGGMGYPGMGMAGGMGYPGMGMAGMGYPGMGMGYPGMGMAGGLSAIPGMGMAGMGMPGMGMGLAGMGMPGMGMQIGGMGMQQQMMQMQLQQYQMYMQQQQQYVQQQMQRQQVVASLQQELYGLLYRIQQVQYGGGVIGGSIGGGLGGGIGGGSYIGGGLSTIPGSTGSGINTGTGGLPAAR